MWLTRGTGAGQVVAFSRTPPVCSTLTTLPKPDPVRGSGRRPQELSDPCATATCFRVWVTWGSRPRSPRPSSSSGACSSGNRGSMGRGVSRWVSFEGRAPPSPGPRPHPPPLRPSVHAARTPPCLHRRECHTPCSSHPHEPDGVSDSSQGLYVFTFPSHARSSALTLLMPTVNRHRTLQLSSKTVWAPPG